MMRRGYGFVLCLVLLGGCVSASAEDGRAVIHSTEPESGILGQVTFRETPEGLEITAHVENVSPGPHGFHIHQYGACGDSGKAAGGHYNPDGVKHGNLAEEGFEGAHAGDLGNLEIGPDGKGDLKTVIRGLSLSEGEYSVAGRAVILHAEKDDFGQPTGNAGGRIGCGIIRITEK